MMDKLCCPDDQAWQSYALGLVAEAEQHLLDEHLRHCPACLGRLAAFSGEDRLLQALRRGSQWTPDPATAAEVERLKRLAVGIADTAETPTASGLAADTSGLLSPASGPGELGQLGPFRVLRLLGQGGMGVVYQAEDTRLQRPVALKVLRPELASRPGAASRFLAEARAMASLKHDHIVTVHQVDEVAGVVYLAMELLEGESLEARLRRGPLPLPEVLRVGREAAEALAAAHDKGLIHRDVKPDNIFLESMKDEGGRMKEDNKPPPNSPSSFRVKLLDFGLARAVQVEARLTERGVVVGTPAYLAPEQAAGREVDGRADLFSLGCVLYRLCTGRLPFPGGDVMAVLTALATQEPVPVRRLNPAVPPALADLIHRLLAKAPAGRPASARQVAALLDGAARQLAETASLPPSRPRPPRSWLRTWLPAAALVAVAALVVLAVVVLRPPGAPAEFVIDSDDPDLVFRADGKGGVVLDDRKADRRYQLTVGRQDPATGEYEIDVSEPVGGLRFSTRTLTIKRGERVALKAALRPPEGPALPAGVTGIDRGWLQAVARLPAAEQVAVVTARLKELNPGFEGPVTRTVENGVVVGLEFPTPRITNLSPVRGLPGLRALKCMSVALEPGALTDLSPLAGLPLRVLWVKGNHRLSDLRPLAGMPLVELDCYGVAVTDLSPLQKCPLERLFVGGTRVRSLEAVKGLPLKVLNFNDLPIDDLGPLASLPLEELSCGNTLVQDLSPLRKLPLTSVNVTACNRVKDLGPLQGLPLHDLDIRRTAVTDLAPLKGARLRVLFAPEELLVAQRQLVQALPKLETINYKPVRQFWADLDAKKPDKGP
jgi:serine/threonine protein kinase